MLSRFSLILSFSIILLTSACGGGEPLEESPSDSPPYQTIQPVNCPNNPQCM
jgi:hypothetical protein